MHLGAQSLACGIGSHGAGGIIGMAILEKFVAKKVPKIREYNLGIAMIIGMLFAIIYDMAVGA